jgi:hypothetical protein
VSEADLLGAALVDCVLAPGHRTPSLSDVIDRGETEALVAAARRHRVLAQVTASLRAVPGAPEALLAELSRSEVARTVHQLKILDDLRLFAEAMAELGVPWLVFKGPVIAHTLYERPELRSFQDVDVLLPRRGFASTLERLESRGCEVLDRNWRLIERERRGQLHLRLWTGSVADVHWHLLNRRSVRTAFPISMPEVFARRRPGEVEGLAVETLDPVDTLVHLALHAALGGADRLLWLSDVTRAIEATAPAWPDVVGRARAWRAGPSVAFVLRRARAVLGAAVPDDVLRELDGARFRSGIGDRLARRPVDGMGPATVWSAVLRDGNARTAGAALARAWRPVANIGHRLQGEPGPDRDVGTGGILKPSGGEEARARYLLEVDPPGAVSS